LGKQQALQMIRSRALVAALLIGVAGCAAGGIDVKRDAHLPKVENGARFTILLTDEQQGEPEYKQYAAELSARLQAHGFVAVPTPKEARYAVFLEVDQGAPAQDIPAPPAPGSPASRGGAPADIATATSPDHTSFGPGKGQLRISMFDLTRPKQPDERVFYAEVTAPSDPSSGEVAFPAMLAAAFRKFPGSADETYTVPVKPPKTTE
jgi:hypothetical protein